MKYDYQWEHERRLVVKGFCTKAELKWAMRCVTRAPVLLETVDGQDPEDGVYEAIPLDGRFRAIVTIHGGCIWSVK